MMITADHGCDPDPAWPTTDHSREYVPIVTYSPAGKRGVNLGIRDTLADMGCQTIAENFGAAIPHGKSFLSLISNIGFVFEFQWLRDEQTGKSIFVIPFTVNVYVSAGFSLRDLLFVELARNCRFLGQTPPFGMTCSEFFRSLWSPQLLKSPRQALLPNCLRMGRGARSSRCACAP